MPEPNVLGNHKMLFLRAVPHELSTGHERENLEWGGGGCSAADAKRHKLVLAL